jgi:uncharacterized cupin superfamily protein
MDGVSNDMEKTMIDEVDHVEHPMGVNSVRRPLSEALGTTDVGIVYYELEPGESFSGGLAHRHHDQEEVFYVLEGEATFEIGEEHRRTTVGEGEIARIPPGEFQKGLNESDERVVAVALSAPGRRHAWHELDVLLNCGECGEETVHDCQPIGSDEWQVQQIELRATCQECGASVSTMQPT